MTNDLELAAGARPESLRLGWSTASTDWVDAMPVGNGATAAMVFGTASGLRLQLNDSSAWSGHPAAGAEALDALAAGGAGPERLAEVRSAILRGDYRGAERLLLTFEGPWSQEFLPLGDLVLTERASDPGEHAAGERAREEASSADAVLARELDLDDAVVRIRAGAPGHEIERTVWASATAGCVFIHLRSETPLDVTLALSTPLLLDAVPLPTDADTTPDAAAPAATDGSTVLGIRLPIDGAPLHEEQAVPLRYDTFDATGYDAYAAIGLAARSDGSIIRDTHGLRVSGATRVLVAVSTDTNGRAWWQGADPSTLGRARRAELRESVRRRAEQRLAKGAQALWNEHLVDVRPLLSACTLQVGARRAGLHDVATEILRGGDDRLVATALFHFGRYLLVSSSRPGSPPANLQGGWNDQLRPPWSSNYTVNINTEMNYWAAESTGLAECHGPLLDLVGRLQVTGTETAGRLYGSRGWVTHHNTDMWGYSLPVGDGHGNPSWAIWMMGGLWLTDHVWQHWIYTLDRRFLAERGWPILVGAAEFALDWLVDDGHGGLGTVPSTSPENLFRGPDGHPESLARSATMDTALIRSLFERTRAAAGVLGLEHPVLREITDALPRLASFGRTADGRLREWSDDLVEVDPDHRHMSQMIAVYPLGLIDAAETPDLAAAAVATLDRRGPGAMGWSWAWKIALRARLGDGGTARALLKEASVPFEGDHHLLAPVDGSHWGGLLPNLFSTHPPVQLDGNFGFTAAIREMVLGTREGPVRLLPALPAEWPDGRIQGARLPGALEVDLRWEAGVPVEVTLRRLSDDTVDRVDVELGSARLQVHLDDHETRLEPETLRRLVSASTSTSASGRPVHVGG